MEQLADISQFEALMNTGNDPPAPSVTTTENGRLSNYIGDKISDRYIFGYGREMANQKNYEAAVKVGKEVASWLRKHLDELNEEIKPDKYGYRYLYDEDSPKYIERGFEKFGRFCANLDIDISQLMNDVNVEFSVDAEERPWANLNTTTICITPSHKIGDNVAHELAHLLSRYPQVRESVEDKINFPGRMTEMFDEAIYPRDRLRSWIADSEYAGKEYPKEAYPNNEYLSGFFDMYGAGRLPMLYALDIKRLLRKINKSIKTSTEKTNTEKEPKKEVAYA